MWVPDDVDSVRVVKTDPKGALLFSVEADILSSVMRYGCSVFILAPKFAGG